MTTHNVIIQWWNWRRHKDLALQNSLEAGLRVICGTNYYCYLNFPVTPWSKYNEARTFDLQMAYEQNPSDLMNPDPLVIGMSTSLWTDWHVLEKMVDQRVFPRIYALAEQIWHQGERLDFKDFYILVKNKYPALKIPGINYGPALKAEVKTDYSCD